MSFANKVIIVTGCSSGIGLATVQQFLSQEAKVFGIDVSPFNSQLISPRHAERFSFHQCNLTEENACDTAVRNCISKYGSQIDVLANVAGIMDAWASADTITDNEWDRVMMINLTVPIRLMRAVLPMMKEKRAGAIVNVCSKASLSGASAGIAYTVSKHGLVG